jgi:uncharacterized protein (TIGR00304 family)
MDATLLYDVGMALVFVGMAVSVIAALLYFVSSSGGKRKTRGGGVIIIGFTPIVFGTDKDPIKKVPLLSLLLTAVLVVAMVLYNVFFR